MTAPAEPRPKRVAPFIFPAEYTLPPRPRGEAPDVEDAYRQTQFLLAAELELFRRGMELQLRVVADSSPSRFRTHRLAALLLYWSRAFAYQRDACLLATRGAYVSCPPLVRAAAEAVAAQQQLRGEDWREYEAWLGPALLPSRSHPATEVPLGEYRAGSALAADPALGALYRQASAFALTHFGGTAMQVAPESSQQRIAVAFGDRAFHLGWAELVLGWLLRLCERQLALAVAAADIFTVTPESRAEVAAFAAEVEALLAKPARCRVEDLEEAGRRRYLLHNFRRASGGAPKKYLL